MTLSLSVCCTTPGIFQSSSNPDCILAQEVIAFSFSLRTLRAQREAVLIFFDSIHAVVRFGVSTVSLEISGDSIDFRIQDVDLEVTDSRSRFCAITS